METGTWTFFFLSFPGDFNEIKKKKIIGLDDGVYLGLGAPEGNTVDAPRKASLLRLLPLLI